jgi:uncharacterized damage-inducible protein DinB
MTHPATPTIGFLRELYRHMEWADARVWKTVLALDGTAVDDRLRGLLHHLHETQRAFLHVWTDLPPVFGEPQRFASYAELHAWARPYYEKVGRYLEAVDDARLSEPVDLPWSAYFQESMGRSAERTTLAETLFQVPSHTTHHRAQVNTRLREVGAEPPLVDYIVWVWFGKPRASWS